MDASMNADQTRTTAWDILNECLPGFNMDVFREVGKDPARAIVTIIKLDAYEVGSDTPARVYYSRRGERPEADSDTSLRIAALLQVYGANSVEAVKHASVDIFMRHISKHLRGGISAGPAHDSGDDDVYFLDRFLLLEFLQPLPRVNIVIIEAEIRNTADGFSEWAIAEPHLYDINELRQDGEISTNGRADSKN